MFETRTFACSACEVLVYGILVFGLVFELSVHGKMALMEFTASCLVLGFLLGCLVSFNGKSDAFVGVG